MSRCLLAAALFSFFGHAALAETWSSFQNSGTSQSASAASCPLEWSATQGIRWQTPLAGYGQSSPVTDGKLIYVTSVSGQNKEKLHVQAFDLKGEQVWRYNGSNSSPEKNTTYVSRAAPTPVCDQSGVITFFEGGNLFAFSPTGEVRWQRDLVSGLGAIKVRHGLGASLEQNEDLVFVWIERSSDPYLLAIQKATGETVWKSDGLGVTSWSSPRLVPVGAGHHLVLSGSGKIAGYDPKTGKRLWEFTEIAGNTTATPFPLGDGRFLIGAAAGRGAGANENSAAANNGVIQIKSNDEGAFTAEFVWRATKATSSFGSPVAHQGRAYFVNRAGAVYCLDLKSGEQLYAKRSDGSIWATPLIAGERLFLFGRNGTTTVIKSGSEFQRLAKNELWKAQAEQPQGGGGGGFGGPVLYAAAVVDGNLLLRRGDRLYFVGK